MSDLKIFDITNQAIELKQKIISKERNIQNLVETNIETLLNVRFLASEYSFKAEDGHNARIDTLGIDENNCPVVIEYKKDSKDTVINQGLFYMDWLLKHQDTFNLLAISKLNKDITFKDSIDWEHPRIICIAQDFSRYDSHAIDLLPRNIDLIRYHIYEQNILSFELVNSFNNETDKQNSSANNDTIEVTQKLQNASNEIKGLYKELDDYLLGLGDDIQKKTLKNYIAYRRLKNFACVEIHNKNILIYVYANPNNLMINNNLWRDVTNIGHYGTGNLELKIKTLSELQDVKPLLEQSFENS